MGWFNRRPRPAAPSMLDGKHELCVVGESYCQAAILEVTGPEDPRWLFRRV